MAIAIQNWGLYAFITTKSKCQILVLQTKEQLKWEIRQRLGKKFQKSMERFYSDSRKMHINKMAIFRDAWILSKEGFVNFNTVVSILNMNLKMHILNIDGKRFNKQD